MKKYVALLMSALLCLTLFACESAPAEVAEPTLDELYEVIETPCNGFIERTEKLEDTLDFVDAAIIATVETVGSGYLNNIKLKNPIDPKQLDLNSYDARHNVIVNVDHIYYNNRADILSFHEGDSLTLILSGGAFGKYYVTSGTPRLKAGRTYFIPFGILDYKSRIIECIPKIYDCAEIIDGNVSALYWDIYADCPTRAELYARIEAFLADK
ncbi:MAG: hypothetical protein HFE63_03585 [Clostridiales bacterium]|nr:hypothetical protein [Clostridiales bacterium]